MSNMRKVTRSDLTIASFDADFREKNLSFVIYVSHVSEDVHKCRVFLPETGLNLSSDRDLYIDHQPLVGYSQIMINPEELGVLYDLWILA